MRSMRTSSSGLLNALALGIPLMAFLPGCPVYWGDNPRSCVSDAECGAGAVCSDGRCVLIECTVDSDCADGELCEGSVCVPGPSACRTHGDCPVGEYCSSGTCTASGECTADAECEATFWCDYRATCVPRDPGACRTAADCSSGELCIEGRCEVVEDTCQFDRECAPGSSCVNNECTAICGSDTDCANGDACIRGFCRPAQECTTSASCATGTHCVDGRCLEDCLGSPTACDANTYCSTADEFCHPDWEPTPFCTVDGDCADMRVCLMGVCRTPCTDFATDCAPVDSQFTSCGVDATSEGESVCLAPNDVSPECRVGDTCGDGRACVNGLCRNDS